MEVSAMAKVKDPYIETLALLLYESDVRAERKSASESWTTMSEEDREIYREIAAGNRELED